MYLVTVTVVGVLFPDLVHGEPISLPKVAGIDLAVVAIVLINL